MVTFDQSEATHATLAYVHLITLMNDLYVLIVISVYSVII